MSTITRSERSERRSAREPNSLGYYRFATVSGDQVFFVCEDDIWSCSESGGPAHRLTTGRGEFSLPRVSPDGKQIAFVGREEGHPEVFEIPAGGGLPTRLTYMGSDLLSLCGWSPDGKRIHFISDAESPFFRETDGFAVSSEGGLPERFRWGHVQSFDRNKKGSTVVGRNASDPARWKRYRGGTKGDIWIDKQGNGRFNRLIELDGNMVWPMLVGKRVYFLSDHEGVGNIYSVTMDGGDLRRHTEHDCYFVRYPSTDGHRIAYTAGGDVYIYDPQSDTSRRVEIEAPPATHQVQRKFVEPRRYLEHYSPHPDGHSLGIIVRGQPLSMGNWEGPALQHGEGSRVRYRLLSWLPDGDRFVVVNDRDDFERLEIHHADQSKPPTSITSSDMGRILNLKVSPDGKRIAVSNHKYELLIIDTAKKVKPKVVDRSPADRIADFSWSPDSRWIAYGWSGHPGLSIVRIASAINGKIHDVTNPIRWDGAPSWDPDGKYLYFLGARDFYPVFDMMKFDYGFPRGLRPFLITLRNDVPTPFVPEPKPVVASKKPARAAGGDTKSGDKKGAPQRRELKKLYKRALSEAYKELTREIEKPASVKSKKGDKQEGDLVEIDFDGIEERILAFPVSEGRYGQVIGARGRALFSIYPVKGIRPDFNWYSDDHVTASVMAYDFEEGKAATLFKDVNEMKLAFDNQTLFYRSRKRIRAVDALEKLPAEGRSPHAPSGISRESGWLDLSRAQVLVSPREEWSQMYTEAWRLQREQFWNETMSDVDWDLVYKRYANLLDRVRTRSEVSDLIWEMQGELGTSHAYEIGGDYRRSPSYRLGFLGADLVWDAKKKGYRIEGIISGDSWEPDCASPLRRPGLGINEGDVITAINGHKLSTRLSPQELLINQGGREVRLTVTTGASRRGRKGSKAKSAGNTGKSRNISVSTLKNETPVRYRHWVESNRKIVHQRTGGKVGYVHIPDMGPLGFAEFHRSYLAEVNREGLIIDVRYNRGGHVSSLLLEKLARKRVGYDVNRWGPPHPYPQESVAGPMVALTNQFAGSDGDIFSHCFKLYKLGPLVGKRTWGGVIGIWPRHRLVDGTITTQPEFSFWFEDVGWGVENYGTDPDYDIDITPDQFMDGDDPQMEKAIDLILKSLRKKPFQFPDFSQKPSLALPADATANGDRRNGRKTTKQSGRQSKASRKSRKPAAARTRKSTGKTRRKRTTRASR